MLKQTACLLLLPFLSASHLEAYFLWRIDTEKPSYLYGTVHSSDPAVRQLPGEVVEALETSTSFHPELEFSPENLGNLTAALFAGGTTRLEDELPPRLWERLQPVGMQLGFPSALLQRVPLQFAPLLLATPPGLDFNQIVDVQLYQIAKEQGLEVRQLETVDEQMAVFRDLEPKEAIAFLEESLDEWENGFPSLKKTVDLYATGDLDALHNFLNAEFARMELPELKADLLPRRNRKMAKRLLPYLEQGGAFVAVGVGHMPGEEGLLSLLAAQGYKPMRIPIKAPAALP